MLSSTTSIATTSRTTFITTTIQWYPQGVHNKLLLTTTKPTMKTYNYKSLKISINNNNCGARKQPGRHNLKEMQLRLDTTQKGQKKLINLGAFQVISSWLCLFKG